jgi:hypothetical protein
MQPTSQGPRRRTEQRTAGTRPVSKTSWAHTRTTKAKVSGWDVPTEWRQQKGVETWEGMTPDQLEYPIPTELLRRVPHISPIPMDPGRRPMTTYERGDEIDVVVTGAQHYGVLVATYEGEKGWIESEYLSDRPLEPKDWPPLGTRLRGLVLGHTSDGRIRVCLREVDGRRSPQLWPPANQTP